MDWLSTSPKEKLIKVPDSTTVVTSDAGHPTNRVNRQSQRPSNWRPLIFHLYSNGYQTGDKGGDLWPPLAPEWGLGLCNLIQPGVPLLPQLPPRYSCS